MDGLIAHTDIMSENEIGGEVDNIILRITNEITRSYFSEAKEIL
jgi:hypothetical protein